MCTEAGFPLRELVRMNSAKTTIRRRDWLTNCSLFHQPILITLVNSSFRFVRMWKTGLNVIYNDEKRCSDL